MGRKVFISFLGTGNYVNCKYQYPDGEISAPVRFIQEALINKLCQNWSDDDRIFILCTEASQKKNWIDNGHVNPNNPNLVLDEIERIGLESRLKATKYGDIVSMYNIKEGFDELEVWEIFENVYSLLQSGDEVYFDVTHAFRSIPMFSTVLLNYASFMKDINVHSIHYGAFEKLGTAFEVKRNIIIIL